MQAFSTHTPVKTRKRSSKKVTPPVSSIRRSKITSSTGALRTSPPVSLKPPKSIKAPHFNKTLEKLEKSASKVQSHTPASKKVADAQAAAIPPKNEKLAGAQTNQVEEMKSAETGKPDKKSFLDVLRIEIQKLIPKKTEDVGSFMTGNDRSQLKSTMTGNVANQKEDAASEIKDVSGRPPDTSSVTGKEVIPIPPEETPLPPQSIDAAQAMPLPKSQDEISLDTGKKNADKLLTNNEITILQMQKANDPRFSAVVGSKTGLDKHADTAPKDYTQKENKILKDATSLATNDEKKGLTTFLTGAKKTALSVTARQLSAKEKDELKRKEVTDHIQGIFEKTKSSVEQKLSALDSEVETEFDRGAENAIAKMREYVDKRFKQRYEGLGKALWVKDQLLPLPDEVKAWFGEAHKVFLEELDALVVRIANLVETRLKEAKDVIAKGQKEISVYVKGQPANLQAIAKAAEQEMNSRFDDLRKGVEDKKEGLAQKLAQRYIDAQQKGEKALQDMKDANKSLYDRVRDAVAEVVKILKEFRDKIMGLLKKGKNTVDLIVADPIGFLKNLLSAITKGLKQFVSNIWEHLKAGFMAWLFGSIGGTGISIPKEFSIAAILQLVLQVLGITYDRIRAKAVKLLGQKAVTLIEKVAGIIKELITGGPQKLWEMMKEYIGNLKEMVVNAIQEWIVTTIIMKAVEKLVTMFNPVGAIVQAIITIYNVVMFFIERINQILAFVESILNSAYDIAKGAIGTAANWVEKALALTVPIIISFLARLLGLSGISEKIVGIIKKIQDKVEVAIDKVIGKIAHGVGKLATIGKKTIASAVNWWKTRHSFKQGDESHELSFKGEGESAMLMIATTPRVLKSYLENVKGKSLSSEQKEKVKKIEKEIRNISKIKKKTKGGFGQQDGENIRLSLGKIAQLLSAEPYLPLDSPDPPETIVHFETNTISIPGMGTSLVGKKMVAEPLSINPGKLAGSQPYEETPLWQEVNSRPYTYVRGHLLNHHVHGPGINKNLVPITRSLNTTMEKKFESHIKKAVLSKNEVVKYEVDVKFHQTPIKRKRVAEGYLPVNIKLSAYKMEKKKNKWVGTKIALLEPIELPHKLPPD